MGRWFQSLSQPDTGAGCCSLADCRVLNDDRWRLTPEGTYEIEAEDGLWLPVPKSKILDREPNPTGGAVACLSGHRVLCFVRPVEA